jgi:hypothetical protein
MLSARVQAEAVPPATGPGLFLLPSCQDNQDCFINVEQPNNVAVCLLLLRYVQFTLVWSVGKLVPHAAAGCRPLLPDYGNQRNIG